MKLFIIEKIKKAIEDSKDENGVYRNFFCYVKFADSSKTERVDCFLQPAFRHFENGEIVLQNETGCYYGTGVSAEEEKGKIFLKLWKNGKTTAHTVEQALMNTEKYHDWAEQKLSIVENHQQYRIVALSKDEEIHNSKKTMMVYVTFADHLTLRYDVKNRSDVCHWHIGDFVTR